MGYCAVFLLALASFAAAQQEDIEYRVTALERLVSSITADFPQYFTQDGTTDYLEAADSCYKCDEEVAKLHERISNQTRVISELEKIVETLRIRLEDLTDRVNGTENFIANPGTAFYNYMDEVAQASCSALARTPHWVWAVPRDCRHGDGMTCDQACASVGQSLLSEVGGGYGDIQCFDAFLVRKTDRGLRTYRYLQEGCSWQPNHCGPNYCCCKRSD